MTDNAWPGDWLRGVLELCVMQALSAGPTYGYAIATELAERGLGVIKGGSLYPLLQRLEQAGLVVSDWRAGDGGPGRKYFSLTPAGYAALAAQTHRWLEFTALTTALLTAHPAGGTR